MTPEQNERIARGWLGDRHRARTDLLWLCNEVLGYKDISRELHGPIIDRLQHFQGGKDYVNAKGVLEPALYEPNVDLWHLEGNRKNLFLDPRGHLKTTLITIAHSIQWMLNYPDIRILLSMAVGDQTEAVMRELLNQWRYNDRLRVLFPEYAPAAAKASDWGNMEGFTVLSRKKKWLKERTVQLCTIGKTIAGMHYEVIKHSDLVDKENVKTAGQIRDVVSHFHHTNPLLERGTVPDKFGSTAGWVDVEGTRYDFCDLYGSIIESQEKLSEAERSWQTFQRSAWIKRPETTIWPSRFPPSELASIESDIGPWIFACQYENNPIPLGGGLASKDEVLFTSRRQLMSQILRLHITVDLAEMNTSSSGDFIVLNTHGFDRDGRLLVADIRCGHYEPWEVIDLFYELAGPKGKFQRVSEIKVEKEAHWATLKPFLAREQQKRGFLPPLIDIKRGKGAGKKKRIYSLQPWFKAGLIIFADEIGCRAELLRQILWFSETSTYHDDILDTLADALKNRDGDVQGDVYPDAPRWDGQPRAVPSAGQFLGFDPTTHLGQWSTEAANASEWQHSRTGL